MIDGWLARRIFIHHCGRGAASAEDAQGKPPQESYITKYNSIRREILISRPYLSLKSRRVPRASVGPRSNLPRFTFQTQSKVVAQLTLLVAITVLQRSCSVAAELLHRRRRLARPHGGSRLCAGLSFSGLPDDF